MTKGVNSLICYGENNNGEESTPKINHNHE
jgi:hypothetical protein